MPTRAAASAHWVFRCSVGATTVMRRTVPSDSSAAAICSAKVVLPAPGVATARKSLGARLRYSSSEIGRASCRERVEDAGGGGAVKKKKEGGQEAGRDVGGSSMR